MSTFGGLGMLMPASSKTKVSRGKEGFNLAAAGVGIFLVVLGHSMGVLPEKASEIANTDRFYAMFLQVLAWIYTFHMPLFFVLSGMNFAEFTLARSPKYADLLRSKAFRLLVPYLMLSTIAYPIKLCLSNFALRPAHFSFDGYIRQLVYPWDNAIVFFWFLPTLFLCFVISPLLVWISRWEYRAMVFLVLLGGFFVFPHHPDSGSVESFFNLGGALHNVIYFYIGIELFRLRLMEFRNALWIVLVSSVLYGVSYQMGSLPTSLFFVSLVGVFFVMMFAPFLADQGAVRTLGKYAFQIYLLSWFFQIPVRIVLGQMWLNVVWVSVVASIVLGMAGPMILTRLLSKVVPSRFSMLYGR